MFREEIDISDTMSASILYENGAQVVWSLNTFMPIEGYHLAFNGERGRIEIRQYERQAWDAGDADEILLARNFGKAERIRVAAPGRRPFRRRPGAAADAVRARHGRSARPARRRPAGAMSVLTGVAGLLSIETGGPVAVPTP